MDISFVYANKFKYRLTRHFVFWFVITSYHGSVDIIIPIFFERANYNVFEEAIQSALIYLPGQFILVYSLLYIIIPKYFVRSRFFLAILLMIFFGLLSGMANEVSYWFFASGFNSHFNTEKMHSIGLHRMIGTAGFAACFKFMKIWYEKKISYSILEKEKLQSELLMLKAQLSPHFLFNTLNNIYSITQNISPAASDVILRLCKLLRYMLYDSNLTEIRLSEEFRIIKDYISLESIRYDKTLDLNIQFPEVSDNYLIAPLLLLPIVENCFKHGTSKMLEQPWISIHSTLKEGNVLCTKFINSKQENTSSESDSVVREGIGLNNIKKRLELLYPGKYSLKIHDETDLFVVELKVELHLKPSLESNEQVS